MRSLVILLLLALVITVVIGPADAFRVDESYKQDIIDVNKDFDGVDDELCWLAVGINLHTWCFGGDQQYADKLWDYLRSTASTDEDCSILNGVILIERMAAARKGKVLTKIEAIKVALTVLDIERDVEKFWMFILGSLIKGELVALNIQSEKGEKGHAVTVYGISRSSGDKFDLYIADPDDRKHQLFKVRVRNLGGEWRLFGAGFDGYRIAICYSMDRANISEIL